MLWLLACVDCPSFDEIEVEDPWGYLQAGQEDEIWSTIHDFATWTGREGVCVGTVEVWRDADHGVLGEYRETEATITVDVGSELSPIREIVQHELCHAVDAIEGFSGAHPELFPYESVSATDALWSEERRGKEAFALACEREPPDLGLVSAAVEACDGSFQGRAVDHFLQEMLFVNAPSTEVGRAEMRTGWQLVSRHDFPDDVFVYGAQFVDNTVTVLGDRYSRELGQYQSVLARVPGDPREGVRMASFDFADWRLAQTAGSDPMLGLGEYQAAQADSIPAGLYTLADHGLVYLGTGGVPDYVANVVATEDSVWIAGDRFIDAGACGIVAGAENLFCPEPTLVEWDGQAANVTILDRPPSVLATAAGVEATTPGDAWLSLTGSDVGPWPLPDDAVGGWYVDDATRLFFTTTPADATATLDVTTGRWDLSGCGTPFAGWDWATAHVFASSAGALMLLDASTPGEISVYELTTTVSP